MMSKFHINKHGVPAPCRATKGNCPLGGDSGDEGHFDTKEQAQEYADKVNESEHSILPGVTQLGEKTNFKKLTEKDKVLRDDFTKRAVYLSLGHADNESYVERKANFDNFDKSGGLEDITNRFDENEFDADPEFDTRQELLYHFPMPENKDAGTGPNPMNAYNSEDEAEAEKRLEDATNAIVDIHEIMQETKSEPLIRRKLAERNEERVFERFAKENSVVAPRKSGTFYNKAVGEHASRVFANMASNSKFYRYEHSQGEAEDRYVRGGGEIMTNLDDRVAQDSAFKLAKEFHNNKVISSALESDNKQIVNRMRKRFKDMFPY